MVTNQVKVTAQTLMKPLDPDLDLGSGKWLSGMIVRDREDGREREKINIGVPTIETDILMTLIQRGKNVEKEAIVAGIGVILEAGWVEAVDKNQVKAGGTTRRKREQLKKAAIEIGIQLEVFK